MILASHFCSVALNLLMTRSRMMPVCAFSPEAAARPSRIECTSRSVAAEKAVCTRSFSTSSSTSEKSPPIYNRSHTVIALVRTRPSARLTWTAAEEEAEVEECMAALRLAGSLKKISCMAAVEVFLSRCSALMYVLASEDCLSPILPRSTSFTGSTRRRKGYRLCCGPTTLLRTKESSCSALALVPSRLTAIRSCTTNNCNKQCLPQLLSEDTILP